MLNTSMIFLDIHLNITGNIFSFATYHKATNSSIYLNYNSCHLTPTKNNRSLSKLVVRIVRKTRIMS